MKLSSWDVKNTEKKYQSFLLHRSLINFFSSIYASFIFDYVKIQQRKRSSNISSLRNKAHRYLEFSVNKQ